MSLKGRPSPPNSLVRRSNLGFRLPRVLLHLWHLRRRTSFGAGISTLVAEPEPGLGEGPHALRYFDLELGAGTKVFVTFPLWVTSRSCLLSSLFTTLRATPANVKEGTTTRKRTSHATQENSYADLRDSYVRLFSGQPADYKEWRQRIQLYHRKMPFSKRPQESTLNIVGSFRCAVWRLFEGLEQLEKDDAFESTLSILDGNYAYDQSAQLPTDFEGYFILLQRQPGQPLLPQAPTTQSCTP